MTDFAENLQSALGTNYQVDRELTGGGMSRVFVATDLVLGRKVVVKVLPPELAAGVNRERFRREIQVVRAAATPAHRSAAVGWGAGGPALVYNALYRGRVAARPPSSANASSPRGRSSASCTTSSMRSPSLMSEGSIHRDIKPANVLTQGSHALVTDFGRAKALSAAMPLSGSRPPASRSERRLTWRPNNSPATRRPDHRMDIYAVGLLAYELAHGHVAIHRSVAEGKRLPRS